MSSSFFTSRLGKTVIRIAPNGHKTVFSIPNSYDKAEKYAEYFLSLLNYGYTFEPVLSVTKSNNVCLSCEG